MSSRFDNRSVQTFKKDIYFSTMMEKYFFDKWMKVVTAKGYVNADSWSDNGCGNDGEFIEQGNTAGADYKITLTCGEDIPLEVKWVPTAGKFTLKEGDLKAYVEEGASILFIYNSVNCGTNMRKPKDYDLDKYKQLVESKSQQIRWGVMWADRVKKLYNSCKENNLFQPISYMGGKSGIVLKSREFSNWFIEHDWSEDSK